MFGGKLPHEFGRLPVTYFQTLVDRAFKAQEDASGTPSRNGSGDDDGVELVDVDALIRKGQREGFVQT